MVLCFERGSVVQPPFFHFKLRGGELAIAMERLLAITQWRTDAWDLRP